jgi:hypothetical protein
MGLGDGRGSLAGQVRKRVALSKGEAGTKRALLCFLLVGDDIGDPSDVQPEAVADYAKEVSNGPFERIDYAPHASGQLAIFAECNVAGASLQEQHARLASRVTVSTHLRWEAT